MKPRKKRKEVWQLAGEVGVDSGQLMVCDPCYVDSEWIPKQPSPGHPTLVLSPRGKIKFPRSTTFKYKWPFPWGNYSDNCPILGMSINDARVKGFLEEVVALPVREFSYRGACDVSHRLGNNFGQLNYRLGHPGVGVAFSSGNGDGVYPVYARRNREGRVVEVRIVMD